MSAIDNAVRTVSSTVTRYLWNVDLTTAVVHVVVAVVLVTYPSAPTPLRAVVVLPLLFFWPGYAVVAALYPRRPTPSNAFARDEHPATERSSARKLSPLGMREVTFGERIGLSFVLNLAILPVVALGLSLSGVGLEAKPLVVVLGVGTIVGLLIGVFRRESLSIANRYEVPAGRWWESVRSGIVDPPLFDRLLNIVLAVAVVATAAGLGFALLVPNDGTRYTNMSLLVENDGGELVANGFPTEFRSGQSRPLVVSVGNHEGHDVTYTLVVQLQRVRTGGDSLVVRERAELDRIRETVPGGETWSDTVDVTPTMEGQDLRLAFLLFRGSSPESPSIQNAYRHTYLWIDVGGTDGR